MLNKKIKNKNVATTTQPVASNLRKCTNPYT